MISIMTNQFEQIPIKSKIVATRIPMDLYLQIEEYRRKNGDLKMSDVLFESLEGWCEARGIGYNNNRGNEI